MSFRHNWRSKTPTLRPTRANGLSVFDHKEGPVTTLDWMERTGPGEARCRLCGTVFTPNKRTISAHPDSRRHVEALKRGASK